MFNLVQNVSHSVDIYMPASKQGIVVSFESTQFLLLLLSLL